MKLPAPGYVAKAITKDFFPLNLTEKPTAILLEMSGNINIPVESGIT